METWLKMRFAPLFWTGAMHLGENDNGIFYVMIMMMIMMMMMRMMMIMRMMAMVMIMRRRGRATNQTKKAHLARR